MDAKLLTTSVSQETPTDGSSGAGEKPAQMSDFLTIQSLTNFGAMTGAISAAWNALRLLDADLFTAVWVPFAFSGAFAIVSLMISLDALRDGEGHYRFGSIVGTVFIGLINALILASAVVGANTALIAPEG